MSTIEQNPVRTTPAPTGAGPLRADAHRLGHRRQARDPRQDLRQVLPRRDRPHRGGHRRVHGRLGLHGGPHQDHDLVASGADVSFARTLASEVTAVDDKVIVDVRSADSAEAARALVLDDDADVWLHKVGDDWTLTAATEVPDGLQAAASTVVRQSTIATNAQSAGTSVAAIEKGATLKASILKGNADKQGFAKGMGFVLAFLFYMASLTFGMQLAGSVVEEKASRIVEIIATKIPVRQLLIGKILGNTALAVGQMVVYTGIGLIGLSFTQYKSYLPSVSAGIVWFLAFFLLGFLVIACAWAVAGALASRTEDLQQTAMPLTMLMMAMWFAVFLAKGSRAHGAVLRAAVLGDPHADPDSRRQRSLVGAGRRSAAAHRPGRRHRPRRRTALPTLTAPDLRQAQHQAGLVRPE